MTIFCNEVVHWVVGHRADHGRYEDEGGVPLYTDPNRVCTSPQIVEKHNSPPH
jgi:hypothetical protein